MKTCSWSRLLGVGGEVQDEEPERQRDLVGGQPDPPGVIHQVEHRADVRPQLVVDLLDRPGRISQRGMRILDDLEHEPNSSQRQGQHGPPAPRSDAQGTNDIPAGVSAGPQATRTDRSGPADCPGTSRWATSSFYGLSRETATALNSGTRKTRCRGHLLDAVRPGQPTPQWLCAIQRILRIFPFSRQVLDCWCLSSLEPSLFLEGRADSDRESASMDAHQSPHPNAETLEAYGLGTLDDARVDDVARHLEDGPACRRHVAEAAPDSFLGRLRDAQVRLETSASVEGNPPDGSQIDPERTAGNPPAAPEPSAADPGVAAVPTVGLSAPPSGPRPERAVADEPTVEPAVTGESPMVSDDTRMADDDGSIGASLQPGTRIGYFGDYELLKVLGEGGMGIVYKARQLSLNRPVALKMIKAARFPSADEVRRFQNEAEAVARLDHPNIVPIFEVGQYRGPALLQHEADRRGEPRQAVEGLRRRPPTRGPTRGDDRRRDPPRPSARHPPPRPEAGEHPGRSRRAASRHRLRPGQAGRRGQRADPLRRDRGYARLHGPGAGIGQPPRRTGRVATSVPPAGPHRSAPRIDRAGLMARRERRERRATVSADCFDREGCPGKSGSVPS